VSCFEKPSIVLGYCVKLLSFSCSILRSVLGTTLQVTVYMQEMMGLNCNRETVEENPHW